MNKEFNNIWRKYWPEIADTMDGGLALISPDGKIIFANKALEKITGYEKKELLGKTCDLFHCDSCEGIKSTGPGESWCKLFQEPDHKVEGCRCEMLRKDGMMVPILKNATTLKDDQGRILCSIETLVDISELEKRDKKIEELSRYRTNSISFHGMQGQSNIIREVFALIEKAALSDFPVVIYGESGTGKELAAHAIHHLSVRRDEPFVAINCASLQESLLESDFFGHVKGAFTSAYKHKIGKFEAAGKGTIFLDEVGDMPLTTQAKLLRVLETKSFERVGDHYPIPLKARFIFATHRNLQELVKSGEFREDLFFRVNVVPVRMPSLRERIDDLPLIAEQIIRTLAAKTAKPITGLSRDAIDQCLRYSWPGNVRELKNALQYAFVSAESGMIKPEHLPDQVEKSGDSINETDFEPDSSSNEKEKLLAALRKAGGNKSEAARILNVARTTVWNRIKKYGITIESVAK